MTDEMPARRLWHQCDFLLCLLHIIFPDVSCSCGQGCTHQLWPLGFSRTHDGNCLGWPATALRCDHDLFVHAGVVRGNIDHHSLRASWWLRSPRARRAAWTSSMGKPTTLVYDPSTRSTKDAP